MSSHRLLENALFQHPELVLDLGVGSGTASRAFVSQGATVVGVDVEDAPFEHDRYQHRQGPVEYMEASTQYDLIWTANLLQCLPNVQAFLVQLAQSLEDDGYLYIAVPSKSQDRLSIGSLTVWTPALLIYNLVCAGWDCRNAEWYTEYDTIGLCIPNERIEDMSWRTGTPQEEAFFNEYTPAPLRHEGGAWIANNWPNETSGRLTDPPLVTAGVYKTNLPPKTQLAYGPNPKLREGYEKR